MSLFDNLKNDLNAIREVLLKSSSLIDDNEVIRPTSEALKVLDALQCAHSNLIECFNEYPSLERLFDYQFCSFREFSKRDNIIELCFREKFIFPEKEEISISSDTSSTICNEQKILIVSFFNAWVDEKRKNHLLTIKIIQNFDSSSHRSKELLCQCNRCLSDFHSRIRNLTLEDSLIYIEKSINELDKKMPVLELEEISNEIFKLQKEVEKKIQSVRNKMRRSSIYKIEKKIRSIIRDKLSYKSKIGSKYVTKLEPLFIDYLTKKELSPDLLTKDKYERFYQQMGINLWKDTRYVLGEFFKVVNSVLRFKRKDISATILQEYLGQFWLHSPARRLNRKIIYHKGPTNSGKTYYAITDLCMAKTGCYLAPLRLLAGEVFDTMIQKGVRTTLLTGEEVIVTEEASHYSSTIEMARLNEEFECAVIDEIQMVSDPQRGWAWTRALIGITANKVHLCGDDSVIDLVTKITEMTGDSLEIIEYERLARLDVMDNSISLGDLSIGDALIVFSRKNALKYKRDLEKIDFKVSIIYGRLGPEVRREQARKFDQGKTDVIVSTDAIAMGMNLPIKRIIFSTLTKYIDDREYRLSNSEIKQIAGRAGRFKRFPVGHITCLSRVEKGIHYIKAAMKFNTKQKIKAMVGPDLDIYNQVNMVLTSNSLPILQLSEFLRLFNTMTFEYPFYCVDLKEMIDLTEIIETANAKFKTLKPSEIFGFSCAPVNMGLVEHIQYFIYILNNYIRGFPIKNEDIDHNSENIDYLETSIKCVELYQWLARHFNNKNFHFNEAELLHNKSLGVEKLNDLLSKHIVPTCSSCGKRLEPNSSFNICEGCFKRRRSKKYNSLANKTRIKDKPKNTKKHRKRSKF